MEADIHPLDDRGETISSMEPLRIWPSSAHWAGLADLALELTEKSTGLSRSLPPQIVHVLAAVVRSMNCYYSNLIEGHDTHPIDIEKALQEDFSQDPKKRNLQLEAKAHIATQLWIEEGGMPGPPTAQHSLISLHRRFCEGLPEDLLWVRNPDSGERIRVAPGQLRQHHVAVGLHRALSPGALPRHLQRFEEAYAEMGRVDSILAAATAHHRLLWMHPFLDGNGRVARWMSFAMLRSAMPTGDVWSIARGLGRNVQSYKEHLAACDQPRRGDLDGRGNLSEAALAEFTAFFLRSCIDQVEFMESLIQPERLRARILLWAKEEIQLDALPLGADSLLEAVLLRGELSRGDVGSLLGTGDRQARRVSSALMDAGVLSAKSTRAPLQLAFPARLAERWLPGLFPAP